jgi:dsRNA-specific ribonuclease
MNVMDLEPFKAPKILGDVFEAIIGAIFKDGGIERSIDVLKSLMAPMVLYVAKFSKNIQKEPKEDFIQLSS